MPTSPKPQVVVVLGGERFAHRMSDLTAIDARDFALVVGFPLQRVWSDPYASDLQTIAGLVWLAKRRDDPRVTYEDVARGITYETPLEVIFDAGEDPAEIREGDDPEA